MFADASHSASPRQPITGIINIIESSASTNDAGKRYKTYRPQNSRACLSLTTHRISQQINVGGDYLEIPTWRIKLFVRRSSPQSPWTCAVLLFCCYFIKNGDCRRRRCLRRRKIVDCGPPRRSRVCQYNFNKSRIQLNTPVVGVCHTNSNIVLPWTPSCDLSSLLVFLDTRRHS